MNFLAQNTINLQPGGQFGTVQTLSFAAIISAALRMILVAAALIFFFMLVWGGVEWILSGGDKGATEKARGRITAALVGLVVVFAAWAIAQLLGTFFGVNIFQLEIPHV
jgi:hypothetical protein